MHLQMNLNMIRRCIYELVFLKNGMSLINVHFSVVWVRPEMHLWIFKDVKDTEDGKSISLKDKTIVCMEFGQKPNWNKWVWGLLAY